jgi:hypothetical protein
MESPKPGRPKKLKLVTIDKALELVKEFYLKKGLGADELHRVTPAKRTIYNKICMKQLRNYGQGKGRLALLDENEVLEKLCS